MLILSFFTDFGCFVDKLGDTLNFDYEPFETTSGVRQGCVLAPALLCIAIDWILSSCAGTMGTTVGSSKFTD